MTTIKFWRWLRDYADGQCRRLHRGGSQRCPNCKLWSWQKAGDRWTETAPDVSRCECGQCGHASFWRFDVLPFGLAISCDASGTVTDQEAA
jgi:hypothetical protein